jgi:integrase
MSSIGKQTTETGTRFFIKLSPGESKQRPEIHLGNVLKKQAQAVQTHIDELLRHRKCSGNIAQSTQEWLVGIPESLRDRLEKLQLVKVREGKTINRMDKGWTVANWIKHYIESRPDVKLSTKRKWEDVENRLAAFFRDDFLGDITVEYAKNFRIHLQTTEKLSENTLRRHIGISRQFFNAAIDAELIIKNPFRKQATRVMANESRLSYVSDKTAQDVLAACPDAEWRLIFGLARYGGLRCPSEVLGLKIIDVDFDKQRFTVHAPKTEHHANKGIRVVPMFPELKPLFQDAFDNAKTGAVYCIERYRGGKVNLRTQLLRILKRAGIASWPKLFQNLRSTRETELFKITGGNVKAVCSWIGNSPAVALAHYAQITEKDMKQAAEKSIVNEAEKDIHNHIQHPDTPACTDMQETPEHIDVNPDDCNTTPEFAESRRMTHNPLKSVPMGSIGLEPTTSCL